ncbi:hypothetical protein GN958_ATG12910 [Phytophthora infestans]|uniref:Uncharacterized protein n=1 Tax=Phytophthora infestans TaxID=4787 RepID=A0A8S9UER3_PHYIN|nr:hypothetical protein GN958_ATG12910 [Phytophthora infestans]
MDRGRRAEPYSNATIWTREIARNLASHLSRVSNAHSCVDTRSPKSTRLPQFHHPNAQKRCPTSPMKTRQPLMTLTRNSPNLNGDQELEFSGGENAREDIEGASTSSLSSERIGKQEPVHGSKDIPAVKPPAKKRTVNGNISDLTTYDSPQRHHVTHDYYKRQEQRKIWQENQALNKRLQSAKATLNFKEWEKDGKWTREFLKTQERRRHVLQQELRRAQISPQAVLRAKPLKLLHHHVKAIALDSDKNLGLSCSLSARTSARRDSKGEFLLGSRGGFEATLQHPSAANHRRIMKLRQHKNTPLSPTNAANAITTEEVSAGTVDSATSAAFIPNNEIVTVRFTFSRGRSRSTDTASNGCEPCDQPEPLVVREGDRDMMSLSGAYSPGAELESELNAAAVNDSIDQPQSDSVYKADAEAVDNTAAEECECYQSDADFYDNKLQSDVAVLSANVVEADTQAETKDADFGSHNIEKETQALDHFKTPWSHSDNEEEKGSYDDDNFDEHALLSAHATEQQHDKLEASGYASEFEDEGHEDAIDAAHTEDNDDTIGPMSFDKQEEDDDEEEYSRDDFE